MASALKRSRTVSLSVERVLESLERKGDGNDGMSSGEESDIYRQLQETGDIYRSRCKVSCVIAQNAWTSLIIHSHRSGKFECERALNSPELEEKRPKLVK